jgi:hypothetical protein
VNDTDAVRWKITEIPRRVTAGESFSVQLTAKIAGGWHVYSISQPLGGPTATAIMLLPGKPFRLAGPITGPKPEYVWDENFEMQMEFHAGTAVFMIPVHVEANTEGGAHELLLEISYQECSENSCRPPVKVTVRAPISVSEQV